MVIWSHYTTVPSLLVCRLLHPHQTPHPRHSGPGWEQQRCFYPEEDRTDALHCQHRQEGKGEGQCRLMTNLNFLVSFTGSNDCGKKKQAWWSMCIECEDKNDFTVRLGHDRLYLARLPRRLLALRAFSASAWRPRHHRHLLHRHLFLSAGLASFSEAGNNKQGECHRICL